MNELKQVVQYILQAADELNEKQNPNDVELGQLMGLCESLKIIQSVYAGEDMKKIGLDFDVDKRYL